MIRRLIFDHLSFHPREGEAIYVEGIRDEMLNEALRREWQLVDYTLREKCGWRFRYLPMLWQAVTPEQLQWVKPDIMNHDLPLDTADLVACISNITQPGELPPGVMAYYDSTFQDIRGFWYVPVGEIPIGCTLADHIVKLVRQINAHVKQAEEEALACIQEEECAQQQGCESQSAIDERKYAMSSCFIRPWEMEVPQRGETKTDEAFRAEVSKLLDDVHSKIEKLRLQGVSEMLLYKLVEPEVKLSRMVVTRDLKIILLDYGGMEIKMTPLVKAVYFLFLRRISGIRFKQLPDYRDELTEIYRRVRGGELSDKARRSIEDVTNPTSNSINEKCARIREAFLSKINETYAAHYIVSGEKNERKRIDLYRDLLRWEDNCLADVPYTKS